MVSMSAFLNLKTAYCYPSRGEENDMLQHCLMVIYKV